LSCFWGVRYFVGGVYNTLRGTGSGEEWGGEPGGSVINQEFLWLETSRHRDWHKEKKTNKKKNQNIKIGSARPLYGRRREGSKRVFTER